MRMSRLSGAAAAVGVLVLLVGSWLRPIEKRAQAAAKPAVVWEYKVVQVGDQEIPNDELNAAGKDGWELVTGGCVRNGLREFICKRAVP